ncbi:hypothetical protein V1506DRAFT_549664 [Lipomyces tetrasporus]
MVLRGFLFTCLILVACTFVPLSSVTSRRPSHLLSRLLINDASLLYAPVRCAQVFHAWRGRGHLGHFRRTC